MGVLCDMGEQIVLTQSDWSGGSYGIKDPHDSAPNEWTGLNVRRYYDGCIGPRPGLVKATKTGSTQNGRVWGLWYTAHVDNELVAIIDNDMYVANFDNGVTDLDLSWASVGAMGAVPTSDIPFAHMLGTDIYLNSQSDGLYHFQPGGPTNTKITNPDGGEALAFYGDRLYAGGRQTGSNPQRVWYTDASDFNTVGASNYFDAGYTVAGRGFYHIRDNLKLAMGFGQWFSFNGTPSLGTLRVQHTREGVEHQLSGVENEEQHVYYWGTSSQRGLLFTDGSTWDGLKYDHIRFTTGQSTRRGAFSYAFRDVLFTGQNVTTPENPTACWWRAAEAFSYHEFGVALLGPPARFGAADFILSSKGDGSTTADFYFLSCSLNRPASTSDTRASPGDDAATQNFTCELETTLFHDPEGQLLRVKAVLVDCYAYDWDASGGGDATLACKVKTWDRPVQAQPSGSATSQAGVAELAGTAQTWTTDTSNVATTGSNRRIVFGGEAVWGGAVSVRFTTIVGMKIKSVSVVCDREPVFGGP